MEPMIQPSQKTFSLHQPQALYSCVDALLALAKKKGASQAEVVANVGEGLAVEVRLGQVDTIEFNRDQGVGITVYCGQSKGSASTSDLTEKALQDTLDAALAIAKVAEPDPYAGLADPALMAKAMPDLDLYHPWDLSPEAGIELAKECEKAGLDFDKRIANSEGSSVSRGCGQFVYGNSHGFVGGYPTTRHSLSCVLVAGKEGGMQRDYYFTTARDPKDLLSPLNVGREAAKRTVMRLSPQPIKTGRVPVLFTPEMARGLLRPFLGAISGGNLYRKSSFLLDSLGKAIFPSKIQIKESPFLPKGLGSGPFDGEGVGAKPRDLVKDGILQGYILSSYSARRLGMETTGNAGGIFNLMVSHDDDHLTFEDLMKKMGRGLVVTEVMGNGINVVTGDYSLGAAGFWVEAGQIAFPVDKITIAGQLKNMLKGILAVGNDVDVRGKIQTGSILVEEMMVAG